MQFIKNHGVSLFLFILIFGCVLFSFQNANENIGLHQKQSLEKALYRGIMECYAMEGRYPQSVDYLVDEYHIIYDENTFEIDYEIVASNIMPSVLVLEK